MKEFNLPNRKIKKFEYVAKLDGDWYDAGTINKTKRTIRLYYGTGSFVTLLDKIEELKLAEEFYKVNENEPNIYLDMLKDANK